MAVVTRLSLLSLVIVCLIFVFSGFILSSTKQEYEMLWMAYNASNQMTKYTNKCSETYELATSLREVRKETLIQANYSPSGEFMSTKGYNVNGLIEKVSTPATSRKSSSEKTQINGKTFRVAATIDWAGTRVNIIQFSKARYIRDGIGKEETLRAQDTLMETISVPIYQLDGSSKQVNLRVRKEVAGDLKAALEEIHEIKFPIETIGVHNDRWDSSSDTLGHPNGIAIDINYTQNPYCLSRAAINKWSSSTSPYKINQQVINIMASHGFTWGIFGTNSADTMHFSADGW